MGEGREKLRAVVAANWAEYSMGYSEEEREEGIDREVEEIIEALRNDGGI